MFSLKRLSVRSLSHTRRFTIPPVPERGRVCLPSSWSRVWFISSLVSLHKITGFQCYPPSLRVSALRLKSPDQISSFTEMLIGNVERTRRDGVESPEVDP
jgi:hypothetical protein